MSAFGFIHFMQCVGQWCAYRLLSKGVYQRCVAMIICCIRVGLFYRCSECLCKTHSHQHRSRLSRATVSFPETDRLSLSLPSCQEHTHSLAFYGHSCPLLSFLSKFLTNSDDTLSSRIISCILRGFAVLEPPMRSVLTSVHANSFVCRVYTPSSATNYSLIFGS